MSSTLVHCNVPERTNRELCVDAKDVKFIMIYYSSCQHIYKIKEEYKEMNTKKMRILTYTFTYTQNYKHSAKLLLTADLM